MAIKKIEIPFFKRINKIFGINKSTILKIYKKIGINTKINIIKISKIKKWKIQKYLQFQLIETPLQDLIKNNILKQINVRTYKGLRHKYNYPVRGQRTHTNCKTQKKLKKKY